MGLVQSAVSNKQLPVTMSSSSTPESLITSRFQLNVARALNPVAPSLAALHINRARSLQEQYLGTCDNLALSHCANCGAFLLDGTGSMRIIRHARTKRRPKREGQSSRPVRALHMLCSVCGHEGEVPVETDNASIHLPITKKEVDAIVPISGSSNVALPIEQSESKTILRNPQSRGAPSPASAFHPAPRPKVRPKKSTGLQDMLARNRQREEQDKKKQTGSGLSAFLDGL